MCSWLESQSRFVSGRSSAGSSRSRLREVKREVGQLQREANRHAQHRSDLEKQLEEQRLRLRELTDERKQASAAQDGSAEVEGGPMVVCSVRSSRIFHFCCDRTYDAKTPLRPPAQQKSRARFESRSTREHVLIIQESSPHLPTQPRVQVAGEHLPRARPPALRCRARLPADCRPRAASRAISGMVRLYSFCACGRILSVCTIHAQLCSPERSPTCSEIARFII